MSDEHLLSRHDFYELLWQEPMKKIAGQFGIQTSVVREICDEFDIPRPPNGYWAQLNWGTALPRPPLPDLDDEAMIEIQAFRDKFESYKRKRVGGREASRNDLETVKITVQVSEKLTEPHAIVQRLKSRLERKSHATDNSREPLLPAVTVSSESLDRVLRILDTVFKHWESVGGEVRASDGALGKERNFVTVSIDEKYNRIEKKETKERWWKEWEYVPTGQLTLELHGPWVDGLRRKWSDGKVQRIETILDSFFRKLPVWLQQVEQRRLDDDCEKRQKLKADGRKRLVEQRKKKEKEQEEDLMLRVSDWEQAQRIRRYLIALDATLESGHMAPTDPEDFRDWREWAERHVDTICPLTSSPSQQSTNPEIENTPLADLDVTMNTREAIAKISVPDSNHLFQMTRQQLLPLCGSYPYKVLSELKLVLIGLGYDMSDRGWTY